MQKIKQMLWLKDQRHENEELKIHSNWGTEGTGVLCSSPAKQSHLVSPCSCVPATRQESGFLATLNTAPAEPGWLGSFSAFRVPEDPPVLKGSEEVDATPVKGLSLPKLHRPCVQPK